MTVDPAPPIKPRQPGCATREVLDRIGDKWATLILGMLANGPRRYGEIAHAAESMNPRVLSRTLRGLERDGLIARTILTVQPPAVCYALTDLGRSLDDLLVPMRSWSEGNIDAIHDARERYDAATGQEDRTPWQR